MYKQRRLTIPDPRAKTQPITVQTASSDGLPGWVNWLIMAIVLAVSGVSLLYTYSTGAFSVTLAGDTNWSWYVVRSSGMIAYTLLAASMVWGLVLSARIFKTWSPGPISLVLHATTSWLAVVLSIAHALLLLLDKYYTYTLADLMLPFVGPYRPFAVGLGVTAFWITLAVTVSFSMRRLIGQRSWRWLHYTSYAAFAMISAHVLLAGTDASQSSVRMILFAVIAIVFFLFGVRLVRAQLDRERIQREPF